MPDNPQPPKKSITPDWLVQGALTKVGDTLDRMTGRGWKPSSSLATSELIERMKKLLDAEIKTGDDGRQFVPHNIKLKMQWDKFSTDADESLRSLQHEMMIAAVDHINDRRYYTYAPLVVEVKPDYFTQGVKLFASFEKFDEERGKRELSVTMAGNLADFDSPPVFAGVAAASDDGVVHRGALRVRFTADRGRVEKRFELTQGKRVSIGRTKENDIAIDHTSVSKMHASLLLGSNAKLVVADTGSTNGTFLNGERIAYGKANEIFAGDKLKFGAIDVEVEFTPGAGEVSPDAKTEAYTVGDMQFTKKTEIVKPIETVSKKKEEG